MNKVIAIAALPLLLGGCLPLPVTIASTAISGISYLTTGKSSTDHVISAAVEQDCNLTRPIVGKAVCRDGDPNDFNQERVVVAFHPGDWDDGAFSSSYDKRLNQGAMDLAAIPKGPAQVAVVLPFARPDVASVRTPGVVVTQEAVLPEPAATPVAVPLPVQRWSEADTAVGTSSAEGETTYVVLGSLRDLDRARRLADRFEDMNATLRTADIAGVAWNRVVVGPYSPQRARDVRESLGTVDGKQPWVVRMPAAPVLAALY